jgi:4-amino-4-deoxy-L-arabinose transferase-like glycosyltransferase
LFLAAAALLIAAALAARWPALNPKTLWYDDLWVAAIASAESWVQAITTTSPAPPGFLLLLRAPLALIGDPEVGAQLVPLLCGLLAIPLVGWIVARLTGSWAGGIAAASLAALNPRVAEQTVHVKHYSVELFVVTLLLAGFVLVAKRPGAAGAPWFPIAAAWLPITAAAALPLMVSGNIAAVLLVNVLVAYVAWHETGSKRLRMLLAGAVFNGLAALLALYVYLPRRTDSLAGYWELHFLPLSSFGEAAGFLRTIASRALTGAAPNGAGWLAILAIPGIVWLLRGGRSLRGELAAKGTAAAEPPVSQVTPGAGGYRAIGVFALLLWVAMVVASAFRIHPVGSRADVFADGVTLVVFGVGLVATCRLLSPRLARACLAASALALLGLAVWLPPTPAYFDSPLSLRVRELFEAIEPDDGLVIYPESSWLVAFYSGYPILFDSADLDTSTTALPVAQIERPNTLSLPLADPAVVRRRLDDFVVRGGFPRLFYFGSRPHLQVPETPLFELLGERGYALQEDRRSMLFTPGARRQDAGMMIFVKVRAPLTGDPRFP